MAVLLAVATSCTPPSGPQGPTGPGCTVALDTNVWCTNVHYGSGATNTGQVVRSNYSGLHPVIIYVHGGGWYTGNFDAGTIPAVPGAAFNNEIQMVPIATWLMERVASGDGVFAINYRMANLSTPGTQAPGSVLDVKLAIRWVKQNGPSYGLDPARITLVGHSAGGHLAVTAASTIGLSGWEPTELTNQTSTVDNVVSLGGPYDFSTTLVDSRNLDPNWALNGARSYLGCSLPGQSAPPAACSNLATTPASPVNDVSSPGFHIPNLYLVTAGQGGPGDYMISSAQYASYAAALTAAGRPFTNCDQWDGNHFDFGSCMGQVSAWLDNLP